MSKVLMISSNTFAYPYPVYPLGMAMVTGALKKKGHSVVQFDYSAHEYPDEELRKRIIDFAPDYIGISVRNIDEVDSMSIEPSVLGIEKRIVSIIRNTTSAAIIIGGSAFSIMPEEILEYTGADYGIVGAGEGQVTGLIESLKLGKPVPRISRGCPLNIDCSNNISPEWEKVMVDFYIKKSGMLNIQTKRGCPYNCSYCVYPSLEGKSFRYRDPDAVIDDIKRAYSEFNVNTFFITDSIFNDPEGHYLEIAEKIIQSGMNIRWAGYFRPKGVGKDEFRLLKRSGLYAVEVGADAGCDHTLYEMGKGFTFEDIMEFYRGCLNEGIASAYFFIFGGPGETGKTIDEGLINLKQLEHGVIFIYSGIRILPGTGLYRLALKENIISQEDSLLRPVYYFSPAIDVNEMNRKIIEEAEKNRRCIFPPEKGKLMIDAMHAFGYRGLLWDELLKVTGRSERHRKRH